jgi:2-amino-4-hydroxy-6-hydroxymethyldihydropteridine diphosphokinase
MVEVVIEIGSNIEPELNILQSLQILKSFLKIKKISNIYETKAVGSDGKIDPNIPNFLNLAILTETNLKPYNLKYDVLRKIEKEMGRKRDQYKFKPRVIDFDLVFYGKEIIKSNKDNIEIPDPDAIKYPHIAIPLNDLIPAFIHPVLKKSINEIANTFNNNSNVWIYKNNNKFLPQLQLELIKK